MENKQDYEARLNTDFELPLEEGSVILRLIAVDAVVADTTKMGQREPFSALFESQMADCVEQGTYTLIHPEIGEVVLFIVPIGPGDSGMRYEAIFT